MKVKVLTRNPDEYLRETKRDIHKIPRNYSRTEHPFETAREYTRALNAVKLERVFAKPFIGCLDGHTDGISSLCKNPKKLSTLYSGSFDGEIKEWDLGKRQCVRTWQAHEGYVRGIAMESHGDKLWTAGDDKTVKTWKGSADEEDSTDPLTTWITKASIMSLTHHFNKPLVATCGEECHIWEESRSEPLKSFQWGVDSLSCVRFNPVETHLLGSCASDRSIILYDIRESLPLRKVVLELKSNSISWNPMEAFIFTCANEDYNLYTFDLRNLSRAVNVHKDHVSAVIDVDYSPTGKEFVSGSYDRTIRIFCANQGHSREVYHTKRMQRLTSVVWSLDNKYVLCGSDEMNIRIWKAKAWEKLGILKNRERMALDYNEKLKEKFANHPQVKKIARHRHVPKNVFKARKEMAVMKASRNRKEANRRAHSKPGKVPHVPERDKHVLREEK